MNYLLLTQDSCPNCETLKRMIAGPLKGRYDAQIERVHRESDPERFKELTEQYGVQAAPALIRRSDGTRLTRLGIGEVRAFLGAEQ